MASNFGQDCQHVFVYGSLMYLPVWSQVVQGVYACENAVATGFQRYAVPNETYPGMVRDQAAQVQGIVWLNVQPHDLARLDAFEGAEYQRETIEVKLNKDGSSMRAGAYLWRDSSLLSDALWSVATFERDGMHAFLNKHVGAWTNNGQRK